MVRNDVAAKADIKASREALRADLAEMKSDLIMLVVGAMPAAAGLIIAAIKP